MQSSGPICIIKPKIKQIGNKVRKYRGLKNFKTLTFVEADANKNAGGSTIALHECCSGELKMTINGHFSI